MPVSVKWLEQPSLVSVTMHDQVSTSDIRGMFRTVLAFAQKAPLYILVDVSNLVSLPRHAVNLFVSMDEYVRFAQHPHVRALAFVGVGPVRRLSIETLVRNLRYVMVDSRDEALAYLRAWRAAECTQAD